MLDEPTCSDCVHVRHTSPDQVFWKCLYWSKPNIKHANHNIPKEWLDDPHGYIALHCHMQPNAPACMAFARRMVRSCPTFA